VLLCWVRKKNGKKINEINLNKFIGIAAYALVSGPGIAAGPVIGKRRKRSLFDEKVEQHLAYRAHKKSQKAL
jgi:hypothetical protein